MRAMNFEHAEPCLGSAHRSGGEGLHGFLDFRFRHGGWRMPARAHRFRRWPKTLPRGRTRRGIFGAERRAALPGRLHGSLAPGMGDLNGGDGTKADDGIHNGAIGFYLRVIPKPAAAMGDAPFRHHGGGFGEDQARAPARNRSQVRKMKAIRQPILGRIHAKRRKCHAIGQRHGTQRDGREKQGHGHARLP